MTKALGEKWAIAIACSVAMAGVLAGPALGQVTRSDYDRALGLREKYDGLVDHAAFAPNWIEGANHFIYARTTLSPVARLATWEYVWVDAESGTSRPAFD